MIFRAPMGRLYSTAELVSLPRVRRAVLVLGLLINLFLVGCQTVPKDSDPALESWVKADKRFAPRIEASESLENWRYSAKASIKADGKTDQFNLDWQFADNRHSIRLFGPLGVGAVRLDFDGGEARLSDSEGVLYIGPDPATLLRDITGLNLPINALQYWLFALPAPNAIAHYQLGVGAQQEIYRLKQLGWETHFSDYRLWSDDQLPIESAALELHASSSQFAGTRLPRRISSQGRGPRGEYIEVKIVTKMWDFAAVEAQTSAP